VRVIVSVFPCAETFPSALKPALIHFLRAAMQSSRLPISLDSFFLTQFARSFLQPRLISYRALFSNDSSDIQEILSSETSWTPNNALFLPTTVSHLSLILGVSHS